MSIQLRLVAVSEVCTLVMSIQLRLIAVMCGVRCSTRVCVCRRAVSVLCVAVSYAAVRASGVVAVSAHPWRDACAACHLLSTSCVSLCQCVRVIQHSFSLERDRSFDRCQSERYNEN